jgi:dTDP-4-amino-4,6-dideoxygalactose transaminase
VVASDVRSEGGAQAASVGAAAELVSVPFFDLGPTHSALKEELLEGIGALIDSGAFTNGSDVGVFEAAFADYCGAEHCVGVASGLDALRLGLIAAGVGPEDEVIVPAYTFAATLEGVVQAGAVPVLVDIGDLDYGIAPDAVEAAITDRTRAVLAVHLYGQMADVGSLADIADAADVLLIEDACQAHGARRNGTRSGAAGFAAAFSFYPSKNLGAIGDAGALVTGDARLAESVGALREHGQRRKYDHELSGYTARLDTLQALVLLRKLELLDRWNEERREAAAYYYEALAGVGDLRLPQVAPGSEPVWHLYVVRTAAPERLGDSLRRRGIGSGRHYPTPLHLLTAFAPLGYAVGNFPVSETLAAEVLSLPLYPGIGEEQLERVVEAVRAYFAGG